MVDKDTKIGTLIFILYKDEYEVILSYEGNGITTSSFSGTVVSSQSDYKRHVVGINQCNWNRGMFELYTGSFRVQNIQDDVAFPHKCPKCNGPAYVGFNSYDCKNKCGGI